jgi:hypothetical protein
MAAEFPSLLRYPIESTNTLLLAGDGPLSAGRLRRNAGSLPAELRQVARDAAPKLAPRLDGGEVYTDDRAPVEWLVDSTLLEYARDD